MVVTCHMPRGGALTLRPGEVRCELWVAGVAPVIGQWGGRNKSDVKYVIVIPVLCGPGL